jgi:hypothetical protein
MGRQEQVAQAGPKRDHYPAVEFDRATDGATPSSS